MKGAVLYGPRDIRFVEREDPKIVEPTDVIIRMSATCVCGSDLWPYRGIQATPEPTPMGHEYCGIVEEVGSAVGSVKPGQFVVGSFATSDNTCPNCQYGYQSSCAQREFITRAQAPALRVPLADGTLVPTPGVPSDDMVPSLLTTSDVLGTGWFAADAAAPLPARADRPRVESKDRPRQGLRFEAAARPGGRGIPSHGRAPCDQDAAATMSARDVHRSRLGVSSHSDMAKTCK